MSTIHYGADYSNVDVTEAALKNCLVEGTLIIPTDDRERAKLFECDPYPGMLKSVYIKNIDGSEDVYDQNHVVDIPNFA